MFGRSKSSNGKQEKIPSTPDFHLTHKSKSDTSLISHSTRKAIPKILGNPLKTKQSNDINPFRRHLKHLDFNDKENKINNDNMNKEEKEIKNEISTKTKLTNINCITSSPFDHVCLFWEIEWDAIEIELKTKTNGVIRSVPMEVGGHLWFVELFPRINTQQNMKVSLNEHDDANIKKNIHKRNVHNCKFNFFVKSNQTPIHAKFALYYTKDTEKESNICWKTIYSPNILVFKKNGAGFDKIVNFSDLCTLCVDNKLRLKIEVQVFDSVITKTVEEKQTKIEYNLENKIKEKCHQIRKFKYEKLLHNGTFGDVILNCNGQIINAHSCILSLFSSKFALLLNEESKNKDNVYSVDMGTDWNPNVLNALLHYIYTEQIKDDVDLLELITIADAFDVKMLVLQCLFKLASDTATLQSDIFEILLWIQRYHSMAEIDNIENMCFKFISCNLDEIISNKQFQSIGNKNPEIFQKLLKFMALNKS